MSVPADAAAVAREAVHRRTVRVLVLTQAVGALGITIGIATASLLARELSGSETLSGLAQTAQVLGAAVISFLLAPLMQARGRRTGLMTGYLVGGVGGSLMVVAGIVGSIALLLCGAMMLGAGTSANSAARYAATDLATDATRGRSLSVVVWATTIGAVLGPNLTGPAGSFARSVGIPVLTGPFAFGAAGMLLAALVVGVLLRPDPLQVAQAAERDAGATTVVTGTVLGRAAEAIRERPVLGYAVAGLALAHAAMVGVMVMTPLHMEHGGSALEVIGLVISGHVLGMFAFSPVVGVLVDRIGGPPMLVTGGAVLVVSLVLCARAPEGTSWQVSAGLFLLGLGWSCAMVSSSTMIAAYAPHRARTDVQGASDLAMGLAAALAGALAGLVVGVADYPTLSLVTLALAVGVVAAGAGSARSAGELRERAAQRRAT